MRRGILVVVGISSRYTHMTQTRLLAASTVVALMLSMVLVSAASALTTSCSGSAGVASITWTGSASQGVAPYSFLWGNGSTSTSQVVAAGVGTHSMTLQTTDASSTVATTTCSATIVASATTTPGVSTQIQALLDQIKALQAQILALIAQRTGGSGTATTTPMGCFGFWRDLKHGDIGDDVKELQRQLAHDDPTIFPPGLISGFFGPKTEAAVKMWQRRYGIDPIGTGFFGMKSRGHYAAKCGSGDSDNDGVKNVDDSDDDNDGTPDVSDGAPFNPNATTTKMMDTRGKKGDNGQRGRDGDDDESDD